MNDRAAPEIVTSRAPSSAWSRSVVYSAILSALVLAIIAWTTHEPGVYAAVKDSFNPVMLLGAIGIVLLRVALGGWRISYASRGHISPTGGVRGQLAWDFFSVVTPSIIGGGPIAAFFMARDQRVSTGESTAIILYLMVLDQMFFALTVPLVIIGQLFLPVLPASLGTIGTTTAVTYFLLILLWVGSLTYAAVLKPELLQRVANRLVRFRWLRRFRVRVERESALLAERARAIRSQSFRFFFVCAVLTIAVWVTKHLLIVFAILCFQPTVDALLVLIKSAALMLGALVMPTPGGSGAVETFYAILVGPAVLRPTLVPSLLVWRVLGYYVFLAAGAFLTMSHHHVRRSKQPGAQGETCDIAIDEGSTVPVVADSEQPGEQTGKRPGEHFGRERPSS